MYIHKEVNKRTEGQTAVDTAERLCSKVVSASGLCLSWSWRQKWEPSLSRNSRLVYGKTQQAATYTFLTFSPFSSFPFPLFLCLSVPLLLGCFAID